MDDEEQPSRIRIVSFGLASAKERFEAFAEFPPQRPTLLSSKWTPVRIILSSSHMDIGPRRQ